MVVAFFVTLLRLVRYRRCSETGHAADKVTVNIPPVVGPHERLVIKTGGVQAVQPIVDRADVPLHVRPALDACRFQSFVQGSDGCDDTRLIFPSGELDDGIGFFNTGAHYAARPVIFETAPDNSYPVGQQRRCQSIAGVSAQGFTVELEYDRFIPVNTPGPR